jgi:bidirectional [NiFe] hydrogenase diaphorase subunit
MHTVQETFGFLDESALRYVSMSLRVPLSCADGVTTFYHYFTLKPWGEHTCVIYLGTACYIEGASELVDAVQQKYDIEPGETTPDVKLSVSTACCIRSCGPAPAVVYDHDIAVRVMAPMLLECLGKMVPHDA